ncbi:MAG: SoxR reducing system RseC family protein [Nitrospirae bacterium]|nr:SoxR reducing system RseC family protein [Nitrospirota bacterium]
MVEETGIITKVDGNMAKVLVQKKSACDGCSVEGACKSTPEGVEIEALNAVHAKVGQRVKILMTPRDYLKGTIIVYGLPLVVFIAGAIFGKNIGEEYFRDINSDIAAACTGFVFLALSLIGVRIWSKKMESDAEYNPVIEEIIKE